MKGAYIMSVTIRDVAALAGVSAATVSRTCNNHPAISAETRKKVWQAIKDSGYQVPVSATKISGNSDVPVGASSSRSVDTVSLNTDSTAKGRCIGVIMRPQAARSSDNPFVSRALRGICKIVAQRGGAALLISQESYEDTLHYLQRLWQQNSVQGFIFLYSAVDDPLMHFMHQQKIPFVVIGKASAYVNDTIYVDNDNLSAGQDAANYLIGLGHKKIAFACDDITQLFAYERHAGYRLAMLQNQLEIPEAYVLNGIGIPLDKDCPLTRLLQGNNPPTALIIVDDTVTLAAMQLCHELGIALPEDLSIITFNNSLMAKLANPPLTTIDINSRLLGAEAASQLMNMLENPAMSPTKIIVPHFLVERASCRKLQSQ